MANDKELIAEIKKFSKIRWTNVNILNYFTFYFFF